jgi:hypothetical protein
VLPSPFDHYITLEIPLPPGNNIVSANNKRTNMNILFQTSRQNISFKIVHSALYEFATKYK